MEWAILAAVALAVAAYVALPVARGGATHDSASDDATRLDELRAERAAILDALRDLDEDAAAGRIDAADRALGRRSLGPRLRAVTEALRDAGEGAR